MRVNVGRLDRFVTEAQRDRGAVDAVLKQLHRRRVTQHMRCDAILPRRGAGDPCHGQMLGNHIGQCVVAERAALLEQSGELEQAERREFYRIIDEQARRMRGLIGDLLDRSVDRPPASTH